MGLGVLLIGLLSASAFGAAVGAAFLIGFMLPITNGPMFAVMQAQVAPEMQGRVLTVMQSAASAMTPLAMLIAGPLADLADVRFWYLMAGAACILMAMVASSLPAVQHLEDRVGAEASAAPSSANRAQKC